MTSRRSPDLPAATAAILAGGKAVRMGGVRKALLQIGGRSVLDRQLAVLRPRFAEILAALPPADVDADAAAPFLERGVRVVEDRFPGSGPMAGLHAALAECRTEWLLAVACDMPYLEGDLIDRLLLLAGAEKEAEALVPQRGGRPEPLHALYRASIAHRAEACLRSGRRAMSDLIALVRARLLGEEDLPGLAAGRALDNVNTPEDLAAAERAVRTGAPRESE